MTGKPLKSSDPRKRMGVFARLKEVPAERRLKRFADSYDGRDVWSEYVEATETTESNVKKMNRAGRRWKAHMGDYTRHHALATPADCERWTEWLMDEFTIATASDSYWSHFGRFWSWLLNHADHPHVYHPAYMAIVMYPSGASAELWEWRMERNVRLRRKRGDNDE